MLAGDRQLRGMDTSLEYRVVRPDGTVRWIWDRGFVIRGDSGEVARVAGIAEDITERKQHEQTLRTMSLVDELTGLYNRRGFLTFADQLIKMADRSRSAIWLVFADVDDLKWINDTFGHAQGDLALTELAKILRDTFRESDVVARIGGDEFVVLAVENTRGNSERLTARLEERIAIRNRRTKRPFPLSLSVGCAYFDPDSPMSVESLLEVGDARMYEQKRARRAS
jgi:diguanylate cyclase (GGDEF)-like protein